MMRSYLLCQEYLHHYAHYTLECEVQVLHCEVVTPYCEVGVLLDDIDVVLATLYSCHEVGNLCQLMIMVIIRPIILRNLCQLMIMVIIMYVWANQHSFILRDECGQNTCAIQHPFSLPTLNMSIIS